MLCKYVHAIQQGGVGWLSLQNHGGEGGGGRGTLGASVQGSAFTNASQLTCVVAPFWRYGVLISLLTVPFCFFHEAETSYFEE